LWTLAAERSPGTYIAHSVAIDREGPCFSGDIDIFHDSEARQGMSASGQVLELRQ